VRKTTFRTHWEGTYIGGYNESVIEVPRHKGRGLCYVGLSAALGREVTKVLPVLTQDLQGLWWTDPYSWWKNRLVWIETLGQCKASPYLKQRYKCRQPRVDRFFLYEAFYFMFRDDSESASGFRIVVFWNMLFVSYQQNCLPRSSFY
jgi:hypothetical protein